MNILVTGNGFDLAHGLPTRYKDFLHFLTILKDMSSYPSPTSAFLTRLTDTTYTSDGFMLTLNPHVRNIVIKICESLNKTYDLQTSSSPASLNILFKQNQEDNLNTLIIEAAKDNFWIKYFQNYSFGDSWIDFESAIARVVRLLESVKINDDEFDFSFRSSSQANTLLQDLLYISPNYPNNFSYESYKFIIQKLLTDLNNLIFCLESYLIYYAQKISIECYLPDVLELSFNKILNFNYINTYGRIYNEELAFENTHFIHGKGIGDYNPQNSKLVLGIDEHLSKDKKDVEIDFVAFKKFFQRIYKKAGVDYKKWLNSSRDNEITFIGHSLDITDKDIIKELITHENTLLSKIYYYTLEDFKTKIINLIKVIGQDELINLTSTEKIIFQELKPACSKPLPNK